MAIQHPASANAPSIALIAAVARNGVIGDAGTMPWRLATDMRRFRALTMGKPVIMGRKTWESLPSPLAGRANIVVSRQPGYNPEGATVAGSLDAAFAVARKEAVRLGAAEIMIIGGGDIYAQTIGLADRLYITQVDASPQGDVRFPPIPAARWRAVSAEAVPAGDRDSAASVFTVYEKLNSPHATGG